MPEPRSDSLIATGYIACEVCGKPATVNVSSFTEPGSHWYCANCEPSGPALPTKEEQ